MRNDPLITNRDFSPNPNVTDLDLNSCSFRFIIEYYGISYKCPSCKRKDLYDSLRFWETWAQAGLLRSIFHEATSVTPNFRHRIGH